MFQNMSIHYRLSKTRNISQDCCSFPTQFLNFSQSKSNINVQWRRKGQPISDQRFGLRLNKYSLLTMVWKSTQPGEQLQCWGVVPQYPPGEQQGPLCGCRIVQSFWIQAKRRDPRTDRDITLQHLLNWQNKQRFQSLDHIDDNLDHQGLVLKDSLICTKDFYCTNHHLLCICNLDPSKIS